MPSISSLGVGSGIDAEGIITKLMAVEHAPVDLLTKAATGINTQLSSIGKLQSLASTMSDKADALAGLDLWGKKAVTAADSTIVSGTASSGATNGSYSISVQQLASSQTVTTASPTPANLSAGTLTIELGSWDGTPVSGFTPKTGASAVTVTIAPGLTSLAAVRDQINAAKAGVTATIVNDASGARLSLSSTDTGAANGFRITAAETADDGVASTGLSALNYSALDSTSPMLLNQSAANAKATINGIQVESASNTFNEVASGLSITVGKVSASPVLLGVADDMAAVKTGIQDFVKAFNDMASYIKDQTKYDATSKTGGPLQGDRSTIGFQSQIRGVINVGSTASSTWSRLSDIGIAMTANGTLEIKSAKLDAALQNPTELRKLLSADGTTTSGTDVGFMDRFRNVAKAALDVNGGLQLREDALNAELKRNKDRQTQLEDRLVGVEARMRAQYQTLDTNMAKLNALSTYMTQQITALNKSA